MPQNHKNLGETQENQIWKANNSIDKTPKKTILVQAALVCDKPASKWHGIGNHIWHVGPPLLWSMHVPLSSLSSCDIIQHSHPRLSQELLAFSGPLLNVCQLICIPRVTLLCLASSLFFFYLNTRDNQAVMPSNRKSNAGMMSLTPSMKTEKL